MVSDFKCLSTATHRKITFPSWCDLSGSVFNNTRVRASKGGFLMQPCSNSPLEPGTTTWPRTKSGDVHLHLHREDSFCSYMYFLRKQANGCRSRDSVINSEGLTAGRLEKQGNTFNNSDGRCGIKTKPKEFGFYFEKFWVDLPI